MIAAEYRHTTARGVADGRAPDPQLHSHVVITGAIREDDRVVAISSRPIFRSARELGAFYRSQLAHELADDGYQIRYGTGKDGRYFELAGVPQGLLDDFSGRSREVARAAERFRARYGRAPERGEYATSRWRTAEPSNPPQEPTSNKHGPTRATATASGTTRRCGSSGPERTGRSGEVEDRIEAQLTQHRAVFDARELRTVALEQTAGQMLPDTALGIAREMVRDRRILTLEDGRMTTLAIRAQEQAIERRAVPHSPSPRAETPVTLRVRARCVKSQSGSPRHSAPSNTPRSKRSPAPSDSPSSSAQQAQARASSSTPQPEQRNTRAAQCWVSRCPEAPQSDSAPETPALNGRTSHSGLARRACPAPGSIPR